MNRLRALIVLVAVLAVALLASLGFLGRALWRNHMWETEAYGMTGLIATEHAMRDFSQGKLRLLALAGETREPRYSGVKEGPFEVWNPQFYPSLGYPHRFVKEKYVEFYNRKMRYMIEHPKDFADPCCPQAQTSIGGSHVDTRVLHRAIQDRATRFRKGHPRPSRRSA